MPVTFDVASHPARKWSGRQYSSTKALLYEACTSQFQNCKQVMQSSLTNNELPSISPRSNGFVHAVMDAWRGHLHLRIRPDDVWTAILNQLNFYINAHAEELRQYFVAHDGQKGLELDGIDWDFAEFARKMGLKIRENVVDSTLVEWILPDFTTTTLHDRAVCSVIMMATLKQYFTYSGGVTCGIPSVTLEGEKSDWEEIYRRLNRLYELGDEPSVWAELLRPIIRRFVRAFDGYPDVKFWEHVIHINECCGADDLSGWLTAFCVWDNKGKWQPMNMPEVIPTAPTEEPRDNELPASKAPLTDVESKASVRKRPGLGRIAKKLLLSRTTPKRLEDVPHTLAPREPEPESRSVMIMGKSWPYAQYTLDEISYFTVNTDQIPAGYCEVDVTLDDDGCLTHCTMIAGHFAIAVSSKKPGGQLDTLSPASHWLIFEKKRAQ